MESDHLYARMHMCPVSSAINTFLLLLIHWALDMQQEKKTKAHRLWDCVSSFLSLKTLHTEEIPVGVCLSAACWGGCLSSAD